MYSRYTAQITTNPNLNVVDDEQLGHTQMVLLKPHLEKQNINNNNIGVGQSNISHCKCISCIVSVTHYCCCYFVMPSIHILRDVVFGMTLHTTHVWCWHGWHDAVLCRGVVFAVVCCAYFANNSNFPPKKETKKQNILSNSYIDDADNRHTHRE